jgi:SHS2 domain-containing protein
MLGRACALLAALGQVVAAFLPWTADGHLAIDLGIPSLGETATQPTVATALILLAAVAAVPALLGDWGVPRALSGLATGLLTIVWLAGGPDGAFATGVIVALAASVVHLIAAALATGGAAVAPGQKPAGVPATPGHRSLDHTADSAFEAWGPTRAACFAQAVRALVDSFVDTTGAEAVLRHEVRLEPAPDEDLLVDLLDEVIYLLDVHGGVPVGGRLDDDENGGVSGTLEVAPLTSTRHAGAVPKAITYHGLRVEETSDGWRCQVTVDV